MNIEPPDGEFTLFPVGGSYVVLLSRFHPVGRDNIKALQAARNAV